MNVKRYVSKLWIIRNPWLVYRTLRGLFRALVLRRETLRVVYIMVTFACQARCRMCSMRSTRTLATPDWLPPSWRRPAMASS